MEYGYNKKSIWKWILLYVVIGAVAYGAIYYFYFYKKGGYNYNSQYPIVNSQDETADQPASATPEALLAGWKTYKNDEHGFAIQYPKDWVSYVNPNQKEDIRFWPNQSSPTEKEYIFKIFISNDSQLNTDIRNIDLKGKTVNFEVGGMPAYYTFEEHYSNRYYSDDVYTLIKGDNIFQFSFPGARESYQYLLNPKANYEISKKILSTFKFTK